MLSAAALLSAWEQGLAQNSVQRALTLLALLWPDASPDALADLTLGRRDWHLLWLREQLFGTALHAFAHCPCCGEPLELELDTRQLRVSPEPPAEPGPIVAEVEGGPVQCRLPSSRDLLAVLDLPQTEQAHRQLWSRCLLGEAPPGPLSETALQTLGAQLQQADPQADLELDLNCPACGHCWQLALDIAPYLWGEVNGWAQRTLREVHLLASAYGWSEREILDLSAARRQIYLQMIGF